MRPARHSRAVSLTTRPDSSLANLCDSMVVEWRPAAEGGVPLPEAEQVVGRAQPALSNGETHDVEFVPTARGTLRLEVRPRRSGG